MDVAHEQSLTDYLAMFWRRRVYVVVPFLVILALGSLVAFLLPAMYRSDATILIESQQIPETLVRSTITTYADERLQVIQQRVLTTSNVLQIIEKFGLFPDAQARLGPTELAETFRKVVVVGRQNAEARGGKGVTIAFSLSFEDREAKTAQAVNNELLSLFLAENVRTRTERSKETTEFLRSEANRLQEQITGQEKLLADFKQQNRDALPELAQANTQSLERLNGSYREVRAGIEAARGKIGLLEAQMAMLSTAGGELKTGGTVWELEQQLQALLARYTEKHPEVIALRERIAEARRNAPPPGSETQPQNPAALQLRSQLDAGRGEMGFLVEQRAAIDREIAQVQGRISRAPQIEQDYNNLQRDLENMRNKYQELRDKELEAKIAQNLEEGQMGERFSVIEPPSFPEQPFAPERGRLMLLVVAAAIGAGVGLAFLLEMMQPALWGETALSSVMGSGPLISVPVIASAADLAAVTAPAQFWLFAGLLLAASIISLVLVHVLVTPLDLLWYSIVSRLSHL